MVPSELMAQLIASLLQRAPRRLAVISTGPIGSSKARTQLEPLVRGTVEPAEHEAALGGAFVDAGLDHRPAPGDDRPERALGADDRRDALLAEAVLEAHHRAVGSERRQGRARGVLDLRRLRRQKHEVERARIVGQRRRRAARHDVLAVFVSHHQPALIHGIGNRRVVRHDEEVARRARAASRR